MIARYELFLQFRKRFPDVFAVPPVDVDFIWHTHMSMNARYHDMCMQHFGGDLRRVSHETVSPEDSAKSLKRDTGFGSTQSAWAEAFPGTALLVCYCPATLGTLQNWHKWDSTSSLPYFKVHKQMYRIALTGANARCLHGQC